ncbi:MAG: transketolase, partial [Solirubrobacterales bacterium]|nr:transketolase [Solirubrobacterales bacterium]
LGDSEMAEGSVWEAIDKAGYYELSNLVVMVDVNRLGQRGPTEFGWDLDTYARRAEAFGARALEVDGHDIAALEEALKEAVTADKRPTVILARTVKGSGFSEVENQNGWHGRPFSEDMAARAIAEIGGRSNLVLRGPLPAAEPGGAKSGPAEPEEPIPSPTYELEAKVATRRGFGDALAALGSRNPRVVVLDGEVGNSTYTETFAKAYPQRSFEMFIAEQQMVAAAVGLDARHYVPFAATFAAFFTRAYDFIRMAAISQANIRLVGSHAGVEIGADGPSQMGLEDLAMMRAVHGSTVLYPSDAVSAAALVDVMADTEGISYMRTTRGAYPVIYAVGEDFRKGGSKLLRSSEADDVTLVGAGVTLHECLGAADQLQARDIIARVIDVYSVKPIDVETLVGAAAATRGRIVVVEDHHPEGGIGSAVTDALLGAGVEQLRLAHLSVSELPGSATPAEQLEAAGIDAGHITAAAEALVRQSP